MSSSTSTTVQSAKGDTVYSPRTQAALDRYGFDNPYDPKFIYRSSFGSKMVGHAQRWPNIDFDELAQVNPDVLGWIHMEGTPLSYPIVAGRFDESYAATHNFSGEESPHGQVTLQFACARRLCERNTVLLAHSMKDWSMFRAVRALCDQDYLDEHPVVHLMEADGTIWRGTWFAGAHFMGDDPWPRKVRFDDDEDFMAWIARVEEGNWLRTQARPSVSSRI